MNASAHKIVIYKKDLLTVILPEGMGRIRVLLTFLSKSLSTISLNMQPALLIKTDPQKKSKEYIKKSLKF